MLVAKDQYGNEVVAFNKSMEELDFIRHQPLFCPECHGKVILKAGQIMTPHFAHLSQSNCNHHGESEEHLSGKIQLFNWFKQLGYNVTLEQTLSSINQRVDLLVKVNHKLIAIEYQCAPISHSQLLKRTEGLYSLGIKPFWIFGSRYLKLTGENKLRLSSILRAAINIYDYKRTLKLFFYNSKQQLMSVASDFYLIKDKSICHLQTYKLKTIRWSDLAKAKLVNRQFLYKEWQKEKLKFRSGQRVYQTNHDKILMQRLYQLHLHPQNLPSVIHIPIQNDHMFLTPSYIWQTEIVIFIIHPMKVGEYIYWDEIIKRLKAFLTNFITVCYQSLNNHPVYQFLLTLEKLGFIRRKSINIFIKMKEFSFHKTLDDAIKEDRRILHKILIE